MTHDLRVGLVLSGGGAKGAYQAGVVKALAELNTRVDAVSGASIGALNGGVVASAPSLSAGASRLEQLWHRLTVSPLSSNLAGYLPLVASAGLTLSGQRQILAALGLFRAAAEAAGIDRFSTLGRDESGLLSDGPLNALMDEYLDVGALANGLPLYISAFKSGGKVRDLLSVLSAELGLADSHASEFFHIQSVSPDLQKSILLASAALPFLFPRREIEGSLYSDGGQGGWRRKQGNTPIAPLIESGCNFVIVTHLEDGSLWSRRDFPGTTVLEIRPQTRIAQSNSLFGVKDVLGFNADAIPKWMQQGYADTLACVDRIRAPLAAFGKLAHSRGSREASEVRAAAALTAARPLIKTVRERKESVKSLRRLNGRDPS